MIYKFSNIIVSSLFKNRLRRIYQNSQNKECEWLDQRERAFWSLRCTRATLKRIQNKGRKNSSLWCQAQEFGINLAVGAGGNLLTVFEKGSGVMKALLWENQNVINVVE